MDTAAEELGMSSELDCQQYCKVQILDMEREDFILSSKSFDFRTGILQDTLNNAHGGLGWKRLVISFTASFSLIVRYFSLTSRAPLVVTVCQVP